MRRSHFQEHLRLDFSVEHDIFVGVASFVLIYPKGAKVHNAHKSTMYNILRRQRDIHEKRIIVGFF